MVQDIKGMTRKEQIVKLLDNLAADTEHLAELKKQTRLRICTEVYNETFDAMKAKKARVK